MRLLILSTSTGNGHLKAAEAIRLYTEKYHPDVVVKEVDYLKYIGPTVDRIVAGGYVNLVKILPMLYGKLYDKSKNKALKRIVKLLDTLSFSKMDELIRDFRPDVVLCTHPFPLETLSVLKERTAQDLPSLAIITDYTIHPKWIYKNIDAYIVPNRDFVSDLAIEGIPEERIYPFGIPVNESFFEVSESEKSAIRGELGLEEDVPTILFMNGGFGLADILETFREVISSDSNIQVIACAGKNRDILSSLREICGETASDKKIVIMGYTDRISELMSISDILITKPGGLTVTEAMHMRLPMIIKSPIPGQEEENAEYLMNCGIAMISNHMSASKLIGQILLGEGSKRIECIKEMESEKSVPYSSKNICELMIELSKK